MSRTRLLRAKVKKTRRYEGWCTRSGAVLVAGWECMFMFVSLRSVPLATKSAVPFNAAIKCNATGYHEKSDPGCFEPEGSDELTSLHLPQPDGCREIGEILQWCRLDEVVPRLWKNIEWKHVPRKKEIKQQEINKFLKKRKNASFK